jgi:ADP-ribosylglycohydrolase
MIVSQDVISGCIFGTAIGDALGLSCEHLSKKRQRKLFPNLDVYHFFFHKGIISDDTEHTCMVAQALINSKGDDTIFLRELSRLFRLWILAIPAGCGKATGQAILKLLLGWPGSKSGVFSAGNGPAMRSAIIGVCYGHDIEKLKKLVRASTRITHTDPKAEIGALVVAYAAYQASLKDIIDPRLFIDSLNQILDPAHSKEFLNIMKKALLSLNQGQSTELFAETLGLDNGVGGYIYHTVPVTIHCWLSHQKDYRNGIKTIIRCGGDTDTTAAITGAIIGSSIGMQGIPQDWYNDLWDWPRSKNWMKQLGETLYLSLQHKSSLKSVQVNFFKVLMRNLFFLVIVLTHGFRRIFPPY